MITENDVITYVKSKKVEPNYSSYNYPEKIENWFTNEKDNITLFLTNI